jgi:hypothetical protein
MQSAVQAITLARACMKNGRPFATLGKYEA